MQMDKNERLVLPKNIRQMGTFGDTYKVYVEDFVYTYVHQFLHQRKKEDAVLAAVLLGKTILQDGQEYVFINGAQKVDFPFEGNKGSGNGQARNVQNAGGTKETGAVMGSSGEAANPFLSSGMQAEQHTLAETAESRRSPVGTRLGDMRANGIRARWRHMEMAQTQEPQADGVSVQGNNRKEISTDTVPVQACAGYGANSNLAQTQNVQNAYGMTKNAQNAYEMTGNAQNGQADHVDEAVSATPEERENEQKNHASQGRNSGTDARQQEFWNRVYQRIKESFEDCEILGWYFNLDGSGLEVSTQLQQFFESTYRKGSRFLYYGDSVEKIDAFFVQEQHRLQRLSGYAVYYEKNPQMQDFMIAERERLTPKPLRDSYRKTDRDEVVENYRAIMNKLNERPARKKLQPVVYVAGAAVLAVVAAMGIGQIGNYQNLKVLEQTMQTLSKAVSGTEEDTLSEESGEASANASGKNEDGTENTASDGLVASDASVASSDGSDISSTDASSGDSDSSAVGKTASGTSGTTGGSNGTAGSGLDETAGNTNGTAGSGSSGTSDSSSNKTASGSSNSTTISTSGESTGSSSTGSTSAGTGTGSTGSSASDSTQTSSNGTTVSSGGSQSASSSDETTATSAQTDYYIVKKGDSLVSISKKLYGTTGKVEEICDLNSIENMDMIYEGQKLLLP